MNETTNKNILFHGLRQSLVVTLLLLLLCGVEIPEEEMAKRRINFYQRQGFSLWEKPYQQPPYSLRKSGSDTIVYIDEFYRI